MSNYPTPLVYVSIGFIELIFVGGGAVCMIMYFRADENVRMAFLWSGIGALVTGLIFNIMLCCYWKSMKVAIAIVDATADFFVQTKRLVFVSLIYSFISCIFVSLCVFGMVCVASLAEMTPLEDDITLQGKHL